MGPRPNVWDWALITACLEQEYQVCMVSEKLVSMGPSPPLWILDANSDFWTKITSLYGSQTWSVVLCMQNSVISPGITSLYESLPSPVVFACKTATFGPEFQVSMGPRLNLSFCVRKAAWLAPELLVSMGPSRHRWFLLAKHRLLDLNYKSLWVPDFTCRFVHAKQSDKQPNY